jgi:quercetin dioxygenase-like cupin family protein
MQFVIALALKLIFFLVLPAPQQPKAPHAWTADTIEWQKVDPDGQKWAVLEGRSDAPGEAFTYAAFIPAGHHEHHWHSSDARVVVVKGMLKVGFGNKMDLQHLTSYPVGSYLFVPANARHTMAADEDTILIGTAFGPWSTHHHEDHATP